MGKFRQESVTVSLCLSLCFMLVRCADAKSSFAWGEVKKISLYTFQETPLPEDHVEILSKVAAEAYSRQLIDLAKKCLQEKGYEVDWRGDHTVCKGGGLFLPVTTRPRYANVRKNYEKNIAPFMALNPPASDAQAILVLSYCFWNRTYGIVSFQGPPDTVATVEILDLVYDPAGGKIVSCRDEERECKRKFKAFGPSYSRPEERYSQRSADYTETVESFFSRVVKVGLDNVPNAPSTRKAAPKPKQEP